MIEREPPMVLGSPVYDPRQQWVPGSSVDYSCAVCERQLIVSPSSLRHMRAWPGTYVHLCPWCTKQVAQMLAREGEVEGLRVAQVPGADAEMRQAGLGDLADSDRREVERIQSLFRRSDQER